MTKRKSIHTFMHEPYEGLGCIENWINKNGHPVSFTKFYEVFTLPKLEDIDWLIVMGGPMGVYDEAIYPWLAEEKEFIREAIKKGKTIIGICLGSQLLAEVLGADVYPNRQKEIGWFDIEIIEQAKDLPIINGFESRFKVFQWHGDTFDLPEGSTQLFRSEVCQNQAYLFNGNVLGLQFHFEATRESIRLMVESGSDELIENDTIQSAEQILNKLEYIDSNNQKMFRLLDYLNSLNV
jgi:GMP synthase-like glutamine amidotransferase